MNGIQSSNEVRQSYINSMGMELGVVYHALWREVVQLHIKWNEYLGLFGSEKRIYLLNQSASGCFRVIQDALWRDIQLHICRLTDPPETGFGKKAKPNLSIQCLPDLVKPELKDKAFTLTQQALAEAGDIRQRRNTLMAHMDRDWALDEQGAIKLPETNRSHVEACIARIVASLHFISQEYMESQMIFDSARLRNGAEGLLYVLHYGVEFQQARKERMKSGKSRPEDLIPPPFVGPK